MILLALFAAVHAVGQPSEWMAFPENERIEYRWSHTASNSCNLEFRTMSAGKAIPKGTYTLKIAIYPHGGHDPARHTEKSSAPMLSRDIELRVLLPGTDTEHVNDCVSIGDVQIEKSPAPPAEKSAGVMLP